MESVQHGSTRINNAIWHLLGATTPGAWHDFVGKLIEVCGLGGEKDSDTLAAVRLLNNALLRSQPRSKRRKA